MNLQRESVRGEQLKDGGWDEREKEREVRETERGGW